MMDLDLPPSAPVHVKETIHISPLTASCEMAYQAREHLCFGISPFNSLFSEDYIKDLISWGLKNFETVSLFLPDEPTFYTLEALGYSESECRRKMKKQLNWLRNKIHKSIEAHAPHMVTLLDWEKLSSSKVFNSHLDHVFQLFDSDETFRKSCLESSRWVLQNKLHENGMTEQALLKAVKYFLSEIPLFAATNEIVGSKTSLFCYHQSIDFHERLYSNQFAYGPALGQGYGVIKGVR